MLQLERRTLICRVHRRPPFLPALGYVARSDALLVTMKDWPPQGYTWPLAMIGCLLDRTTQERAGVASSTVRVPADSARVHSILDYTLHTPCSCSLSPSALQYQSYFPSDRQVACRRGVEGYAVLCWPYSARSAAVTFSMGGCLLDLPLSACGRRSDRETRGQRICHARATHNPSQSASHSGLSPTALPSLNTLHHNARA